MKNLTYEGWNTILSATVPVHLKAWLNHAGSFMQRLKQHGVHDVRIQVLDQSWQLPEPEERKLLRLNFRVFTLVREVFILSDTKLWLFARSLFPFQILQGEGRQFSQLKTRALGSVLFKDKNMKRSSFEFMQLQPGMMLHDKMKSRIGEQTVWMRRSLFSSHKNHCC